MSICEHDIKRYRLIGIIIWALDSYLKDLKLSPCIQHSVTRPLSTGWSESSVSAHIIFLFGAALFQYLDSLRAIFGAEY